MVLQKEHIYLFFCQTSGLAFEEDIEDRMTIRLLYSRLLSREAKEQLVSLSSAADRRRTIALIAGDACVFLIFAAVGRASHHEASGLAAFGLVVLTALPFALGWFVVAPFSGVYRESVTTHLRPLLGRTALGWLCAWPVAMLLRWLFTLQDPPLSLGNWVSFALVVLVANLLFLSIWRGLFALVANRGR
jgi:hypothetical protein